MTRTIGIAIPGNKFARMWFPVSHEPATLVEPILECVNKGQMVADYRASQTALD